jgi:hypothetical protein
LELGNNVNLDSLRKEMLEHLKSSGIVVFHSHPRSAESALAAVPWDTEGHPDFREFVAAALAADVKMMTMFAREFSSDLLEEAVDQFADAELDRDQRRAIESRLRELQAYEGFVCQLELSFDHGERVYVYDQRTEWYDDLTDLMEQIDDAFQDAPNADPLGGFYSNN